METPQRPETSRKPGWFGRLPRWVKLVVLFVALVVVIALLLPVFARPREVARRATVWSTPGPHSPGLHIEMGAANLEEARQAAAAARAELLRGRGTARPSAGAAVGEAGAGLASLPSLETWGRQLILTASVELEVPDVREAYEQVQHLAAAEGALITSASLQAAAGRAGSSRERGGYGRATLVLRMPQSRFYAVRQRLLDLAGSLEGKVVSDKVSSEDVTEEYVDLKARLRHWQSQEAQLLEVMRRAQRIPDILSVRNELASVQEQIERLTGRLRFLESRVDLSTITVQLYQKGRRPVPVKPTIASTWTKAGKAIAAAWAKSLRDVVYVAGLLAAAATYVLPFAAILAVIWAAVRAARPKVAPRPGA